MFKGGDPPWGTPSLNADQHGSNKPPQPRRTKPRGDRKDVGAALRAAYQEAVAEAVPPEMLDLLGKLD